MDAEQSINNQGITIAGPLNKIGKCHTPQIIIMYKIVMAREYLFVSLGKSQPRQPNSSPIPITNVCRMRWQTSINQLSIISEDKLIKDRPPIRKEAKVITEAITGNNKYHCQYFLFGISFRPKFFNPFFPSVREVIVTAAKPGP